MAKKIDVLEQRMKCVEQLLLNPTLHSQQSGDIDNVTPASAGTHSDIRVVSRDVVDDDDEGTNVAAGCSASTATDIAGNWKRVSYRKIRNKNLPNEGSAATAGKTNLGKPNKQKVVVTRPHSDGTLLKTGVEIVPKSVVHIDNLGPDCTEALLKDYLLSADIPVLTCFKAKSWLRDEEKDKVTAFRVCIPTYHRDLIFDTQLWAQGTIIRDWQFKGKQNGKHA